MDTNEKVARARLMVTLLRQASGAITAAQDYATLMGLDYETVRSPLYTIGFDLHKQWEIAVAAADAVTAEVEAETPAAI